MAPGVITVPDRHILRPGWRRWTPRYPRQLGHRGAVLMLCGVLWMMLGLTVFTDPDWPYAVHTLIPREVRSALWIASGVTAVIFAWRPPGFSDAWGWTALYVMPAVRVVSFAWAWVDSWVPWGTPGYPDGYQHVLINGSMLAVVLICSSWPEPVAWSLGTNRRRREPRADRE